MAAWRDTYATLHLWTQIVGKIRLSQAPWRNHSWHTTLYLTPRGLTTSLIPYREGTFQIDFDFLDHHLRIRASDGGAADIPLRPQAVAEFHDELFGALARLGIEVKIHGMPNEIENPIPFRRDRVHASYDPEYANRLLQVLIQTERVFTRFQCRFVGKCSPVHFFWGSFDLAVTRFSGRRAPEHPGGIPHLPDWVVREAYSHELSSAGFWPGGGPHPFPLFYSYAYPEPHGFSAAAIRPEGAFYSAEMREFVLPYDVVRVSPSPDEALLAFLDSTYAAAADLGGWDRTALERERQSRPGP